MSREISVPDDVYSDVEQVAQRLGMTPEEFIADAAQRTAWQNMTGEEITARLNAACEEVDSSVDPVLAALQEQVLDKEEW